MAAHHSVVVLLMHEAAEGGEAAHHQQFHIAGIAIGAFQRLGGRGLDGLPLVLGHHQIHQGPAVGSNHTGSLGRSRCAGGHGKA